MRPISFYFEMTPYPFDVFVSFNQTDEKFKKDLADLGIDDYDDPVFNETTCRARTASLETGQIVMRFKDFEKTAVGYSRLAHEIWHAVEFLFYRLKTPHSVKYTSECYAYMIQYVTNIIYKEIGIK